MKDIENVKLITAIKTPYLDTGEFDLDTYDHLVERQIEGGVQGIVICGTTGEVSRMRWSAGRARSTFGRQHKTGRRTRSECDDGSGAGEIIVSRTIEVDAEERRRIKHEVDYRSQRWSGRRRVGTSHRTCGCCKRLS